MEGFLVVESSGGLLTVVSTEAAASGAFLGIFTAAKKMLESHSILRKQQKKTPSHSISSDIRVSTQTFSILT